MATGEFFNLKENTTALLCLSTDYIAGKMMLVRALTLGWNIDVVEPNNNPLENTEKKYNFRQWFQCNCKILCPIYIR